MENILNPDAIESGDRIIHGVIHKRSHSICSLYDLEKSNKKILRVSDSVKITSITGSKSQSLDRKEKNRCFSNCCRVVNNSNNAFETSNGKIFPNGRSSRWDTDRKFKNRTNVISVKPPGDNRLYQNRGTEYISSEDLASSKADFKNLLTMFLKRSSIYALNQVGNSSTTRRKIFWAFILILGLIGSSYQIGEYLLAYFSYPVVVNIDITSKLNTDFPAVTVCNINSVRREYLTCLRDRIAQDKCQPIVEYGISLNVSFIDDLKGKSCNLSIQNISEGAIEGFLWQSSFLVLDEKSQIKYGHQKADFIRSCSYNGEVCTVDNFTSFVNNVYGNCFTFNAANGNRPPLKTSYVGPNSGLQLELNIEADKYAYFTSSVGARVQIHDPYHNPDITEDGINVSPGFETTVTLSKFQMLRLKPPYKDRCEVYDVRENIKICQLKCFNEYFLSNCSCTPYSYALNLTGIRHCDFSRLSDFCCVYSQHGKMECNCPLSCKDIDYLMTIFSAGWPADNYFWANQMEETIPDIYEAKMTLLKLKVYYDTLEVVTYQQKPMYQSSELFSQIGGQMGLWLGLSLVAIFECVENFILIWKYRERHIKSQS